MLSDSRHVDLVVWLTTPPTERDPRTQVEFASKHNVSPRTVREWMSRDDVRRAWSKHADKVVGDPSNVQAVLEEMMRVAMDSTSNKQVQAAKLYLEAVDAIKPPDRSMEVKITSEAIAELSDEQLEARIAEAIAMQRASDVLA